MFSSLDRWSQCNKLALKVTCVVFEKKRQHNVVTFQIVALFPSPSRYRARQWAIHLLLVHWFILKTWTFNLNTKCAVRFYTLDFWVFVLSSIQIFRNGRTFRIYFFSFFLVSMVKWYKQPRCHLLNFQLKGLVTDNQKQDFDLWPK